MSSTQKGLSRLFSTSSRHWRQDLGGNVGRFSLIPLLLLDALAITQESFWQQHPEEVCPAQAEAEGFQPGQWPEGSRTRQDRRHCVQPHHGCVCFGNR